MLSVTSQPKPKSPSQPQEAIPSFIRKTYDILEEAKYPQFIDWTPDGAAIVIKKPAEFAQKVLPAYFKHSNLTSFVRQLNMYNFHKRRTLDVGHVYFHDLFQRGKKHLLKEIKRKNAEHQGVEKGMKGSESTELSPQAGPNLSSLAYENQCIKQLYNEALTKISIFEQQLKQLTMQNQTLWNQIRQQKVAPIVNEKKKDIPQEQIPMTLGGTAIPVINFSNFSQIAQPTNHFSSQENPSSVTRVTLNMGSINSFQNHSKSSAISTDASRDSPAVQTCQGSEENFNTAPVSSINMIQEAPSQPSQPNQPLFNPFAANASYPINSFNAQMYNPNNSLSLGRKEMSVGQIFEAWGQEGPNNDMLYFADQKKETTTDNNNKDKYIINMFQDTGVLGKRPNDYEGQGFIGIEPAMKRHELSVWSRKRMTSTATEENNEGNTDMDLMDFRF